MQCKDVEFVVEQEGLAPPAGSSASACGHLQSLPGICSPTLAAIVSVANELPAEVETARPPCGFLFRLSFETRRDYQDAGQFLLAARRLRPGGRASARSVFAAVLWLRQTVGPALIVAAGVVQLRRPYEANVEPNGGIAVLPLADYLRKDCESFK